MKRLVLFLFMLMSFIETFAQLPDEIADKAWELASNQEYDNVIATILPYAKKMNGKSVDTQEMDRWATNLLGYCYEQKNDFQKAIVWFEKASSFGSPNGQFNLGRLYDHRYGTHPGVTASDDMAKKYYLMAINNSDNTGDAREWAICNYAIMLREKNKDEAVNFLKDKIRESTTDMITPKRILAGIYSEDFDDMKYEAFKLYRSNAEKGDLYSCYEVGCAYMTGKDGVDKNLVYAAKWFTVAVENVDDYMTVWGSTKARAKRYLGYVYDELYRKDLDSKCLKLALKWLSRNVGDIFSCGLLEKYYNEGVYNAKSYSNYSDWENYIVKNFSFDSDVDVNVPQSATSADNTYALIIANENYDYEQNVEYVENDGSTFYRYCNQTLGIPKENITYMKDATLNKMKYEVNHILQLCGNQNDSKLIFYYAGHGMPSDDQSTAFLLPVDGMARDTETGMDLNKIYEKLGRSKIPTVAFIDACFSGGKRDGNMLMKSRGVAIKVKEPLIQGNLVVMTACRADESALSYDDQQHGLFTYCLLKNLQKANGKIELGSLFDNISREVRSLSLSVNKKSQSPTVIPSNNSSLGDWRKWILE